MNKHTKNTALAALALTAAGLGVAACGSSTPSGPQTITITKDSNGKTVSATTGDTVNATLAANPSTGFIWIPESGTGLGAPLIQTGSSFVPNNKSKPGGAGMQTLHFHVASPGTVPVVLVYTQPLHRGNHEKQITVTISAAPKK